MGDMRGLRALTSQDAVTKDALNVRGKRQWAAQETLSE